MISSNVTGIFRHAEKFLIDNSPAILTGVGMVGTVSTGVLAYRAGSNSSAVIIDHEAAQRIKGEAPLTNKEKAKLTWMNYIPPVASGAVTIVAIFGANHISAKRMAALAAGYSLLDGKFEDYKDKAKEKLGMKKEDEMRAEIAQDGVDRNPPPATMIIVEGKSLFKDEPSGRYFECTMEKIRAAENTINRKIAKDEYAVLTDLYMEIGLTPTSVSEEYGWDISNDPIDISYKAVITPDGKPCICLDYNIHPIRHVGASQPKQQKLRGV